MGDHHLYITSVLTEDHAADERFVAAASKIFRYVWTLPPGSPYVYAVAMYDKDFDDGLTFAIKMIDVAKALSGILADDIHIVIAWEPYGGSRRRRVWRIAGSGAGSTLPEIPGQDDAQEYGPD